MLQWKSNVSTTQLELEAVSKLREGLLADGQRQEAEAHDGAEYAD